MNKHSLFFLLILVTGFYSCRKCDKKYICPVVTQEALTWLPFNLNDTIKFINTSGRRLIFTVTSKTMSPEYEDQACKRGEIGCSCDYRCEANARVGFISDSLINNLRGMGITVKESTAGHNNFRTHFNLTYDIFDFTKQIDLAHPTQLFPGDSLISTLTLGNNTYSDVYVQTLDTLITYNQNKKVWKGYYTKANGIIGFRDRESQALYYRE